MKIITAPTDKFAAWDELSLFLAGGISDCPAWQSQILKMIKGDITVYNPRRKKFPMDDPKAAYAQISWEYHRLRTSDILVFWFARGSLNPIALYELGMWGNSRRGVKAVFIGCDPKYERKQDVVIQTEMASPMSVVANSLAQLAEMVNHQVAAGVR